MMNWVYLVLGIISVLHLCTSLHLSRKERNNSRTRSEDRTTFVNLSIGRRSSQCLTSWVLGQPCSKKAPRMVAVENVQTGLPFGRVALRFRLLPHINLQVYYYDAETKFHHRSHGYSTRSTDQICCNYHLLRERMAQQTIGMSLNNSPKSYCTTYSKRASRRKEEPELRDVQHDIISEKSTYKEKLRASFDKLEKYLQKINSGCISITVLDRLLVDCNGIQVPVKRIADISYQNSLCLKVTPFDETMIRTMKKKLENSLSFLDISTDGKSILVKSPPMSGEQRNEVVKELKLLGENTKVAIRHHRRDVINFLKKLETEGFLSEDSSRHDQKELQKEMEKWIKAVEDTLAKKAKDITQI